MSNYKYRIGKREGIAHMIITIITEKEDATTYIPLEHIERSIELYKAQVEREENKKDESTR